MLGYVICKKIYPKLPGDLCNHELLQATAQRVPNLYETLKERKILLCIYSATGIYMLSLYSIITNTLPTLPIQQSHLHIICALIFIEIMSFSLLCYVLYQKIYSKLPHSINIHETLLSYMPTKKLKHQRVPSGYYIEEVPKKESPLIFKQHKNIIFDPTCDQLQVYQNCQVCIY